MQPEPNHFIRLTYVLGLICAAGCLVIAVFNTVQGALPHACMIPLKPDASTQAVVPLSSSDEAARLTEDTINLNTATAGELAAFLPGIGEKKSKAIVAYREAAGGFDSVEELTNVEGIGRTTMEKLRPYCRVSDG